MARRGQRQSGGSRNNNNRNRRRRELDNDGIIPVLARSVREVESAVERGNLKPSGRTKFQVVAILSREERNRVKADTEISESDRGEQLKRLDGIGTILAKTAAREPQLFGLLAEDAVLSDAAKVLKEDLQRRGGLEVEPEVEVVKDDTEAVPDRAVLPQAVISRQLANPFLVPDFSAAELARTPNGRLATWELLGPLLTSFERASSGATACMPLPEPTMKETPAGLDLMRHQAELVAAVEEGHRTFLLADEPGLGKTAQALLAAEAADAFPLVAVVPNVVKTNWAREAGLWTPNRRTTVIHGDGHDMDGFADIVVVNYEILDRHVGWLGRLGFRGMIVDEAHFIKNRKSQRSQHVLELSHRIQQRTARPLLMALTGTPLINDIDDFRAIWQFLGWIDEKKPLPELMARLEDTGLAPGQPGFYAAARSAVVNMGIVRRRKVDVAADIPERRIADIPVELDDAAASSIRKAEQDLARRLVKRYHGAAEARRSGPVDGIDHELIRRVAGWELSDGDDKVAGDNVFTMVREIGLAKAGLAADYAAQLARSVGKVVFFAKHIAVMDEAEETFAARGIGYSSVRGDQTPKQRQSAIDSFVEDEDVSVIVCSLMAAGVGLNLQVSSNVVLAELSWTDAEQTQAIDRVHRIGQSDPVTAWRIIAAQTLDTRIAELIDSKAGLAARALDGSDEEVADTTDIQLEAMVSLLTDALVRESGAEADEQPEGAGGTPTAGTRGSGPNPSPVGPVRFSDQ